MMCYLRKYFTHLYYYDIIIMFGFHRKGSTMKRSAAAFLLVSTIIFGLWIIFEVIVSYEITRRDFPSLIDQGKIAIPWSILLMLTCTSTTIGAFVALQKKR